MTDRVKDLQEEWADQIRAQGRNPYERFAVAEFRPYNRTRPTWTQCLAKAASAWKRARKYREHALREHALYVQPNPFTGRNDD